MVGPGGCSIDLEECHCDCHKGMSIQHIMPCCEKCRYCGKRIAGRASFHEEHCPARRDPEDEDDEDSWGEMRPHDVGGEG
ncbi:hypothetical protein HY967_00790 [Candidatus Jorgensenbacteria bacterium]|nr:hypothetical protein [Candidatus Jorgensenbacteria bacterium]